jgi:glycerophosphoryl diester phosphodiesterase
MRAVLQQLLMRSVDALYGVIPQPVPAEPALQRCRLVSHRGEHDNINVIENTLPAFRQACDAGVWGLETDIRWSRDLVPLLVHDANGARLFGYHGCFANMDYDEIRARMP